ncbi:amidohydrolase family protein [Chitinophaga nivalis]|uniref:Amidohydrolase family protein n=1 Tax=Chitinophaga nivalis TaxID=2991709 RepID=A0ABT3IRI0_9BACT|nr:amidohydrolase family protein [Chitinophaga nivalis]MCW3463713.1 amidohydrolase family protein [Chitinophaga nivalis]MCW3486597.1 amidohydrolase family protein [Chitinophaga nivalis]
MIIDAHQHFWQYHPVRDAWIDESMAVIRRDFLPADLAPVLAANDVQGCVAVQADQSATETAFLLSLAADHAFIRGVVGWVDLRAADIVAQLEQYAAFPQLKGFRHIVQVEADDRFLLREDFCRGIQALAAHDFTYDILVYPKQLPAVTAFVQQFPEHRLIIDHLAKPAIKAGDIRQWAADIRRIAQAPRVYCKLSGLVTEADWQHWQPADIAPYLEVALEAFGSERLVFGSDWPVCQLAASYEQVKGLITSYISQLSATEQAQIMGGNAISFYQL